MQKKQLDGEERSKLDEDVKRKREDAHKNDNNDVTKINYDLFGKFTTILMSIDRNNIVVTIQENKDPETEEANVEVVLVNYQRCNR